MPSGTLPARTLGQALAAVLVMSGLGLVGSGARSTAAPPAGLSPAGGVSVAGIPTLTWARQPGVERYDVQVATNEAFTNPLVNVGGTYNHQYVPTVQLPAGELWWRVRAAGSGGTGWSTASFKRSTVAAPAPTGPPNDPSPDNALPQPGSPPVLSWEPVPGVTQYEVEYGTDSAFTDPLLKKSQTTKATSFVVPLQAAATYYWRVRGQLGAGFHTEWSAAQAYAVRSLETPARVSPNNGDTGIQDVVLDWQPVDGAAGYDLQVSTDENFPEDNLDVNRTNLTSTRFSPPQTLDNDQYYWRVRAVDAAGNKSPWPAGQWIFRRSWPDQPHLEWPEDGATVGDPLYFQWSPYHPADEPADPEEDHTDIQLASHYSLQLSTSPTFSTNVQTCTTVHTTYTPSRHSGDCWPTAAGTYYWRVGATDKYSAAAPITDLIRAEVRSFTYFPELVTVTHPPVDEPQAVPTLRWEPRPGAAKYKVTISTSSGPVVTVTTAALSFTPRARLDPAKQYRWQVQTVSEDGRLGAEVIWSDQRPLVVAQPPSGVAARPEPSPADLGASYRFPTLQWTPVAGATAYRVRVRRTGAVAWTDMNVNFAYPAGEDTGVGFLQPGTYEWYVEARGDSGYISQSSAPGTFTISQLPRVPVMGGYRAALTGNALTGNGNTPVDACAASLPAECQNLRQTPVLGWSSPHPEVGFYKLSIYHDQQLTNPVSGHVNLTVNNTMWANNAALPDSQAGSAYFWVVVPCLAEGVCAPLQHAQHAFNKLSRPVVLVSPAESRVPAGQPVPTVEDDVTLTWEDYLCTQSWAFAGAPVEPTGDDECAGPHEGDFDTGTPLDTPARIEARQYRVQTATDPAFTQNVKTIEVDQRTYTLFDDTYPEGPVFWRVQAIDGSGNFLTWSETRQFLKVSDTPALAEPAAGATVRGDQTLSWEPLPFAKSYDVEVYRNDDQVPSGANLVSSQAHNTQRVTTTLRSLEPAATPYRWRVRRRDARNRPGAWSELRPFTVTGPAPALVAPAAGSAVHSFDGLFTWEAEPFATRYRFERRAAGSSSTTETQTTAATAWAPTSPIAGGTWQWRVTGLDSNGKPLGSSAWRSFDVVEPPVTATVGPTIVGTRTVGSELEVRPGSWTSGVRFSFQWFRQGVAIPDARGQRHRVAPEDAGKVLHARVIATRPGYAAGTAYTGKVTIARMRPGLTATASPDRITRRQRGKIEVQVSVDGPGPTGRVTVLAGRRALGTKTLTARSAGRAVIRLNPLRPGRYRLTVTYAGSTSVLPASRRVTLVVTR